MLRKLSFYLFCIIMILTTFLPQGRGIAASSSITIFTDSVNVRGGPSLSYNLVKQAKKGEKYTVLKEQGDWIEIDLSNGKTGWVANWLVSKDSANTTTSNGVVNGDNVNVRKDSSSVSPIIRKLSKGTSVTVYSTQNNWTQIQFSGQMGWVNSQFIDLQTSSAKDRHGNATKGIVGKVTASSLSIRSSSSLNASVLGTVKLGQSFTILEENNNWVEIEYKKGSYGWVAGWYLDKSTPNSSTEQAIKESNITILQDGTNIRKAPNVQSDVVQRANEGDTFAIKGVANDWYEIALKNGSSAFVAGWMVSINGTAPRIEKNGVEPYLKNKTIVLDPGHGGEDNGTTGASGTHEKNLTIRTATLLYNKLKAAGANVYLTRNDDTYIPLPSRVSIARSLHADAFISLHYDSSTDRSTRGMTGYYYHSFQKQLANYLYTSTVNQTRLKNRGVRFGDFHVIRENSQIATLIELGYLSNPEEEMTVNSEQFQENAATGLYNGLARFFKEN